MSFVQTRVRVPLAMNSMLTTNNMAHRTRKEEQVRLQIYRSDIYGGWWSDGKAAKIVDSEMTKLVSSSVVKRALLRGWKPKIFMVALSKVRKTLNPSWPGLYYKEILWIINFKCVCMCLYTETQRNKVLHRWSDKSLVIRDSQGPNSVFPLGLLGTKLGFIETL